MAGEAIFIGYRRDDTADVAGRIYDAMGQRFGRNRIFKDVDNIGPGVDFGDYIKTIIPKCRVALILIGPHWLESKTANGRRRIDDPNDWVRIEIQTALATRNVLVVPVLVNGAHMPDESQVPDGVKPLLRRNAAIIRRDPDFHDDVERLASALGASVSTGVLDLSKLGGKASGPARGSHTRGGGGLAPLLGGLLLVGALGFGVWSWLRNSPEAEQHSASAGMSERNDGSGESETPSRPPTQTPDTSAEAAPSPSETPQTGREREPAPPPAEVEVNFRDCPDICPHMTRIPGHAFAAGRYEVTFAQWDACVREGGCNGYRPNDQGWGRGNRPVVNVSWNDAQAYVQWLSRHTGQRYRLLTSAEWDIAARAGTTTSFSWGNQAPVCDASAPNGANFIACTDDRTRPVGSFQPNAFGLYDVHGNAWEWVEDCFDGGCANRTLRGGSSDNYPDLVRSVSRLGYPENGRSYGSGFRVARAL